MRPSDELKAQRWGSKQEPKSQEKYVSSFDKYIDFHSIRDFSRLYLFKLGSMKGACLAWKQISTVDPSFCSARLSRGLSSLEANVDNFPREVR